MLGEGVGIGEAMDRIDRWYVKEQAVGWKDLLGWDNTENCQWLPGPVSHNTSYNRKWCEGVLKMLEDFSE